MGSNVKHVVIWMIVLMFVAVAGIFLYANIRSDEEREASAALEEEGGAGEEGVAQADPMQIGNDTRAFLADETFFDPDKQPYSSIEKIDGKSLSLLMTSVQKDLRIQIVDNAGKLVTGENFCVVLNGNKEYQDDDKDGVIYIEYLRAGDYEVELKEVEGYRIPDTSTKITVKQSVEYVVIDDIDLLILTEDQVNAELEDLEANDALDDADKSEITGMQEGNPNAKMGIDVSKWNKEIDWDKVKNAGVEFAIIRVGYRGATTGALVEDPYFEKNIKGAIRAGIPVGVYFFTQATDVAVEEASMVMALCRDYKITYPVFIDVEGLGGSGRADGLDVETRTAVSRAFCATIESEGYRAGVYSSRNWLNQMLDMDKLKDYVVWLAEYRDVPIYQGYYHMWQYTSNGSVDGIEGRVDFNLSYLKIENPFPDVVSEEEEEETEITPEDISEEEIEEPKPIGGTANADF